MAGQALAVVGVFSDSQDAQQVIQELLRAGFRDDQLGVAARHLEEPFTSEVRDLRNDPQAGETYAAEGAATGVAAGAGLGALCGLAFLAGMLPPIGPAIAGGTLAVILTSAAAGAAAVGLAGALAGLGITKEEAQYYESEFQAGRIVLAVTAEGRAAEARAIIERFGGFDLRDQTSDQREPASPGTLSAVETRTPVAMPMEPGVPANVNLAGELIESERRGAALDVPVRSEDLVDDSILPPHRSTIHVPVPNSTTPRQS